MTPHEVKLWAHLRQWRALGYHFRRQHPQAGYILDFVCLRYRLAVELDGGGHAEPMQTERDSRRDGRLHGDGFRVLRFWNYQLDDDLPAVLDAILAALADTPPTALRAVPPPRSGEG